MKNLRIKSKLTGRTREEHIQKNDGESFRKHILNYGIILTDGSRYDEKGCHRDTEVYINGMIASIEILNGEVNAWGVSTCERDINRINMRLERSNSEFRLIK